MVKTAMAKIKKDEADATESQAGAQLDLAKAAQIRETTPAQVAKTAAEAGKIMGGG
jgi:F0F1-type ATP synthase membrane subunit b/b'